jgi:putative addiction module component (TIGR02574 family)
MEPEQAMPTDKTQIAEMSLAEKCEWLDAIWASIESDPAFQEMPDWHRDLLKQRLERMRSDPHPGFTIEEVFSKLASRSR